ncbi:MAG: molybdate ABC transporter substrate-binding protein [Aquisalimonadaceae bacterium]
MIPRSLFILLLCLTVLLPVSATARDRPPVIAAAASMQPVLQAMADRFEARTGAQVRFSFGASGNLRRQITRGAPFQLFLSADAEQPAALMAAGRVDGRADTYALGSLALVLRDGLLAQREVMLEDLPDLVREGLIRRFAIASPEHAPYGIAARSVLQQAAVWEAVQGVLVIGENVGQTAQFMRSGAADAGLVAGSFLSDPRFAETVRAVPLAPDSYQLPRHDLVLLEGAGATARAFRNFVLSADGRAILEAYGFRVP